MQQPAGTWPTHSPPPDAPLATNMHHGPPIPRHQIVGTILSGFQEGQRCWPDTPGSMGNYYICCGTLWIPVDNGTVPCPPMPPATSCDGATTGQECTIQNQTCPVGTPGASPTGNRCCGGWWVLGENTPCPQPAPVGEYMLPFHVNFSATSGECMNAPEMDFATDVGMWNNGSMDGWYVSAYYRTLNSHLTCSHGVGLQESCP